MPKYEELQSYIWQNTISTIGLIMSFMLLILASIVIAFTENSSLTISALQSAGIAFLIISFIGISVGIAAFFEFKKFHRQYNRIVNPEVDETPKKPQEVEMTSMATSTMSTSTSNLSNDPYSYF